MRFNFKKFGEAVKFKRTAGLTTHDKPYNLREVQNILGIGISIISRLEHGEKIDAEYLVIIAHWAELNLYDYLE